MKNLFQWINGRQLDCEYQKFTIWFFSIGNFGTDCYILHYLPNTNLPEHTDPVKGKNHYRLNINLFGGGGFICKNVIFKFGTIVLFRPDNEPHSVINSNHNRWILSIGWVKK